MRRHASSEAARPHPPGRPRAALPEELEREQLKRSTAGRAPDGGPPTATGGAAGPRGLDRLGAQVHAELAVDHRRWNFQRVLGDVELAGDLSRSVSQLGNLRTSRSRSVRVVHGRGPEPRRAPGRARVAADRRPAPAGRRARRARHDRGLGGHGLQQSAARGRIDRAVDRLERDRPVGVDGRSGEHQVADDLVAHRTAQHAGRPRRPRHDARTEVGPAPGRPVPERVVAPAYPSRRPGGSSDASATNAGAGPPGRGRPPRGSSRSATSVASGAVRPPRRVTDVEPGLGQLRPGEEGRRCGGGERVGQRLERAFGRLAVAPSSRAATASAGRARGTGRPARRSRRRSRTPPATRTASTGCPRGRPTARRGLVGGGGAHRRR